MEYTSRSLEIVSKEILCQRREPEGECERKVTKMTCNKYADGDEIDDVEEASVDDDSPPPRNRQRLSC
jgi:hypothetical protein